MEDLQIKVIDKLTKDANTLGLTVPPRNDDEGLDDYVNKVLLTYNDNYIRTYLEGLETSRSKQALVNSPGLLRVNNQRFFVAHWSILID
ncbi:MAG: hypothetical protein AAGC88_14290 [Bacteroidota bacterium]